MSDHQKDQNGKLTTLGLRGEDLAKTVISRHQKQHEQDGSCDCEPTKLATILNSLSSNVADLTNQRLEELRRHLRLPIPPSGSVILAVSTVDGHFTNVFSFYKSDEVFGHLTISYFIYSIVTSK